MKAVKVPMGPRGQRARRALSVLAAGLAALLVGTATAQGSPPGPVVRAQHVGPSPKVVSKIRQPVGAPHKASSFAPHPTKRRVFGAPIPPPIVSHVQPKKPRPK
jgi:hypothetical protein